MSIPYGMELSPENLIQYVLGKHLDETLYSERVRIAHEIVAFLNEAGLSIVAQRLPTNSRNVHGD